MKTTTKAYSITIASAVSIPTPEAYWKLEEASGTRADALGVAANGLQVIGPETGNAPGKILNGLVVDTNFGIHYETTNGNTLNYNPSSTGLTVCFWIKFTQGSGFYYRMYLNAWDITFLCDVWNNQAIAHMEYTGPDSIATIPFTFTTGTWFFVAFQYLTSSLKARVSVNAGSWTDAATTLNLSGATTIPASFTITPIAAPTCVVDELGMWFTALTDQQVAALYNSGSGKTYPF